MAGSGHKQFMASLHQDDDRRGKAGKMEQATLRTLFGPFCFPEPEGDAASTAEAMSPVPLCNLHRTGGQPEKILIQAPVYFAQTFKSHPFRCHRPFREVHGITGVPVKLTQIVLVSERQSQLRESNQIRDPNRRGLLVKEELVLQKSKPPGQT